MGRRQGSLVASSFRFKRPFLSFFRYFLFLKFLIFLSCSFFSFCEDSIVTIFDAIRNHRTGYNPNVISVIIEIKTAAKGVAHQLHIQIVVVGGPARQRPLRIDAEKVNVIRAGRFEYTLIRFHNHGRIDKISNDVPRVDLWNSAVQVRKLHHAEILGLLCLDNVIALKEFCQFTLGICKRFRLCIIQISHIFLELFTEIHIIGIDTGLHILA